MSKPVKIMITSFAILLIASIAAIVVLLNVVNADDEEKELTIEEVVKYSYQTPEVTTDLEDGTYVRIQFQIITDGKAAYEEISQRDFQLVNILIKELAIMNEEDFKSGLSELEEVIKTKLNDVMTEGQITDVYTIDKILQ